VKTTYKWLTQHCDHGLSPQQLADRLTMAGVAVEGLRPAGDDWLIEAEITSNRADWLSTIGIAREVAALTGKPLVRPVVDLSPAGRPATELTRVNVEDLGLCPRYTARLIMGVRVKPSPPWLVDRLEKLGLRPINNVADITNYVMFECGQPLHAFDFDLLGERRIVVRRARPGEKLKTIDGRERELTSEMLVIADAAKPVAVAGIMGGLDTEVSGLTVNVLLESAQFEGSQIRRTSRKLGLASDASYRFERGVDPVNTEWASQRAAALIAQIAGGTVAPGLADVWAKPFEPRKVTLRYARLNQYLGLDVPHQRVAQILASLDFGTVAGSGDEAVTVSVPPFRADVTREVDLIEEVARIHGYDRIPDKTQLRLTGVVRRPKAQRIYDEICAALVGAGFHEALTSSIVDASRAKMISPWTDAPPLRLRNPIRAEEDLMRLSILPNLLKVKAVNLAHGVHRTQLFEMGAVYLPRANAQQPTERNVLATLNEDGFLAAKGDICLAAQAAGLVDQWELCPLVHPFFDASGAAEIRVNGKLLAVLGELNPQISAELGFKTPPALAEVDLDLMIENANLARRYAKAPVFPPSSRDIAIVLDESVTWQSVEACVRKAAGTHLEEVRFFDLYHGKQVPAGKKSLAFSIIFRAPDRTLTSEEVDATWQAVVRSLTETFGATLRTA
jgi:phenylalanyl-tRNA synthetase beta chain